MVVHIEVHICTYLAIRKPALPAWLTITDWCNKTTPGPITQNFPYKFSINFLYWPSNKARPFSWDNDAAAGSRYYTPFRLGTNAGLAGRVPIGKTEAHKNISLIELLQCIASLPLDPRFACKPINSSTVARWLVGNRNLLNMLLVSSISTTTASIW